jgi:hypothetical protein
VRILFTVTNKQLLRRLIDEAYGRQSWHGPNLRGSLRGLGPAQAEWRPASGRHSIRELALHAAYWKYAVRRRLTGDERGSFALVGSNWFEIDPRRTWADDLKLLAGEHKALCAAIDAFPAARLNRPLLKNGETAAYLVRGIAAHDLYHAGQIQLLKRLQRKR